jgi:hypothetical protein
MGFTSYMEPLRIIAKNHTAMGDPLDREFSASLHRGLSDELRELADFGLGGHASDMHDYMLVEVRLAGSVQRSVVFALCSHHLNFGGAPIM